MTVQQIRALGPALARYLGEFDDCFGSFDTRCHLMQYVQGQLSDLQRKSVEPIAHLMEVPPRTLQEFLSLSHWDHDRLRDTLQRVVARDHAEPEAIGIIDESGHPKKGTQTACVHREYCGASGKIDNCVMSVHLSYASFDGRFRTMIDSDVYMPEKGWDDRERRSRRAFPTRWSIGRSTRSRWSRSAGPWTTGCIWGGSWPTSGTGRSRRSSRGWNGWAADLFW